MKEIKRVGLRISKNYNSFESSVEREIEYNNEEERDTLIAEMYAECRKDIARQIEIQNGARK